MLALALLGLWHRRALRWGWEVELALGLLMAKSVALPAKEDEGLANAVASGADAASCELC